MSGIAFFALGSSHLGAQTPELEVLADYRFVRSVAASNELVYFATDAGIVRYHKGREQWEPPLPVPQLFLWTEVVEISAAPFGELFARTATGWYVYDDFTENWFAGAIPPTDRIYRSIPPPSNLQVVPGSIMRGSDSFFDITGLRIDITDIIDDQSGYYWIGTNGAGPARTRSASGVIEPLTIGLAQQRVDVLLPAGDSIWCGGLQNYHRGGITAVQNSLTSFTQLQTGAVNGLPRIDLRALLLNEDTLYCGTERGVLLLVPSTNQIVRTVGRSYGLPGERITAMARSGDTLYVGTDYGAAMLWHGLDSSRLIRPSTIGTALVYDIKLVDERLWLATDRGCFRWRDQTDALQSFVDSNRILFAKIFQISVTSDRLWFVSPQGLVWLDRATGGQGGVREAAVRSRYRALAANERFVAVSSEQGVQVMSYRGKNIDSRDIRFSDGLPSTEVSALAFTGDHLWIGTDQGLARVDCTTLGLRE